MNKVKTAGIVIFCVMLAAGFFSTVLVPQKEYSEIENRQLETKPQFSMEDVWSGEYQERYERYLNDQMLFRDQWVSMAVSMERSMGKRDINGVYIGKDGYLLEKYEESDFEPEQTEENTDCLSAFLNDVSRRFGKEHVTCMMIPSKAGAMPGKLPPFAADGISSAQNTADTQHLQGAAAVQNKKGAADAAVDKLRDKLDEPGILLDTKQILQAHQDEYIYFRTDHHWTVLGAYYAYCAWADMTGHQADAMDDFDRETVFEDFYGTTYNKVHIKVPRDQVELFHSPKQDNVSILFDGGADEADSFYFHEAAVEGFNRYQLFLSKNTARIEIQTKAQTGKSLLLIKDSFANCFVPFLAGDYDQIVMVDFRYGKENIYDVLDEYDGITDVMVMYNTEKFMQDVNLHALDKKEDSMEKFDMDDFFRDMDEE